jgi:large conductance mechanosensitive channel
VSSLVADLIMPVVGAMVGGIHYENLFVQVGEAKIMYGRFVENVLDFLIIAWVIFLMVRLINRLRHKDADQPPAAAPPRQEQLLEEIRDLLRKRG